MPYLIVVFFLFAFSIFEFDSHKSKLSVAVKPVLRIGYLYMALALWFIAAFRFQTGADWQNYINMFNRSINPNRWYGIEPGFMRLNAFFKQYSGNFYVLQVVILTFCQGVIFYSFYKNSECPCVTLFMYIMLNLFFTTDMAQTRQHIAMAICLCGIPLIYKRKLILWLLLIVLAMQFHISAILAFPLYFTMRVNINCKTAFLLLFTAAFIALFGAKLVLGIVNTVAILPFAPKRIVSILQRYLASKTEGQAIELSSGLGFWGKYIFYIVVLFLYAVRQDTKNRYFILNFLIGIILKAMGKNFDQFGRVANYYWICGYGLFAYNILFENQKVFKLLKELQLLLCFLFMTFHFLLFYKDLSAPKNAWLPYQSFVLQGES